MKKIMVIGLLLFVGWLILLASEPACGQTFPYGREALTEPDNAHYVGKGGDFRSIGAAVAGASTGDVIYIWPGTYTEDIAINTQVYLVSMGRHAAIVVGTITLGVDGVELFELKLAPTGTNNPIGDTAYYYSLWGCWVDCDSWEVGNDSTYTDHCVFTMTADSGWSVSGRNAIWHDEYSRFGMDIPIESSAEAGIAVDSGATLVLWGTQAYSDDGDAGTPLFYVHTNYQTNAAADSAVKNKILLYNCRMVNDNGPVLALSDTATASIQQSYLESGHATSPAMVLQDSSRVVSRYDQYKSTAFDVGVRLQTRADCEFYWPMFWGSLWADSTNVTSETEGAVNIYGPINANTTAKEVVADTNNTAVSFLNAFGRILIPTGFDFLPQSAGGADLGTEALPWDSVFTNNLDADSIAVNNYLVTATAVINGSLIQQKGSDIASTATITLGAGNAFVVTGTADIDSISTESPQTEGSIIYLIFTGSAASNGLVDGKNLTLVSTFAYTTGDVVTLMRAGDHPAGTFYEVSRSAN
jgi:hypothetical protein